jgi:hypothetical protein
MSTPVDQSELPVGLTLEPDYISVPGQRYALVSFVGPEFCRQKSGRFAIKIRGVFATQDEAKAFVKRIQRSGDNLVDIFLMEMGNWAPCPPDPMSVESQEYQETFLNDLMQGYAASQQSAKEVFADRKAKVMKEGLDAHLLPEERLPHPSGPLSPPEKLPKLEKEIVPIEEEEEPADATEAASKVFDSEDVWVSRHAES